MATIPEALSITVRHHQAGELSQAEKIYRQILDVDPSHADALHLSLLMPDPAFYIAAQLVVIPPEVCLTPPRQPVKFSVVAVYIPSLLEPATLQIVLGSRINTSSVSFLSASFF